MGPQPPDSLVRRPRGVLKRPTLGGWREAAFTGDQWLQAARPTASGAGLTRQAVRPFPAGPATPRVGPWLGSHCGAGSGFTPTSGDTRTVSGPRVPTTRSAGGAGSARAPRSGTRRPSSPGDVLGGGDGGGGS